MSERPRPSWMQPIQYVDDRFEPSGAVAARRAPEPEDVIDTADVEELLRRPDRAPRTNYECNDTTPVDYSRGPHEEVFGVDDDYDAEGEPLPTNATLRAGRR